MSDPKTIVILAAGEFPRRESVLRLLGEADMLICCDSAAQLLIEWGGREPDLIVGDMDSLPEQLQERYADRLRHFAGQEDNDLTKALHCAIGLIEAGYRPDCRPCPGFCIHILGATGRREDHTLGNISLLCDYARELSGYDCTLDMVSDWGRFVAACGQQTFKSVPGQEVSIFAFNSALRMSATGLKYPLDGVVFDSLWKASLNIATGGSFTLIPSSDSPYLVYFCNPGL